MTRMRDTAAERILARFSDIENNPEETIAPYLEFNVDGRLYYFTPGGFLYRREPANEQLGGSFCGYLADEVWHYRTKDHYYLDDDSLTVDEGGREEVHGNTLSLITIGVIGVLVVIILLIVLLQLI